MIVVAERDGTFQDASSGVAVEKPRRGDTVVLSPLWVQVAVIRLPSIPLKEIAGIVEYQLPQLFPHAGTPLVHRTLVLERRDDGIVVLVAVVPQESTETLGELQKRTVTCVPLTMMLRAGKRATGSLLAEPLLIVGSRWLVWYDPAPTPPVYRTALRRGDLPREIGRLVSAGKAISESNPEVRTTVRALVLSGEEQVEINEVVGRCLPDAFVESIEISDLPSHPTPVTLGDPNQNARRTMTRNRLVRFAAWFLLGVGGLVYWYVTDIQEMRMRIADLRDELESAQSTSDEETSRAREAEALLSELEELENRLPLDAYRLIGAFVTAMGDEVEVDTLTIRGGSIQTIVRGPDPFSVARAVQVIDLFRDVQVTQVTAMGDDEYRFSVSAEYIDE